jgi:hypothetical protein
VGQFGVPGTAGIEGHEQDAFARGARRMEELRNLFPAQHRRKVTGLFRIGSVSEAPSSAERLDVEKAQSGQVLSYGICRQLALLE